CGHPACSRCADTRRARQILGEAETPPAAPTSRLHPSVAAEQPLDWANLEFWQLAKLDDGRAVVYLTEAQFDAVKVSASVTAALGVPDGWVIRCEGDAVSVIAPNGTPGMMWVTGAEKPLANRLLHALAKDLATNHSLLCPSPTASPCVEHVGVVMRERLPGDGGDVAYPRLWRPLPAGTELYALPTVGPEQPCDPDGWLIAFVEQDGGRQSRRTFFQREKPAGEYLGCATPVWFVNAGGAS
ncbi:MAG: hypothetical protein KA754_09835, partial [Corallincola sp.]|nr:hypothetical protein [Corallincola sp.]